MKIDIPKTHQRLADESLGCSGENFKLPNFANHKKVFPCADTKRNPLLLCRVNSWQEIKAKDYTVPDIDGLAANGMGSGSHNFQIAYNRKVGCRIPITPSAKCKYAR
jgi:hypothetical protein